MTSSVTCLTAKAGSRRRTVAIDVSRVRLEDAGALVAVTGIFVTWILKLGLVSEHNG